MILISIEIVFKQSGIFKDRIQKIFSNDHRILGNRQNWPNNELHYFSPANCSAKSFCFAFENFLIGEETPDKLKLKGPLKIRTT